MLPRNIGDVHTQYHSLLQQINFATMYYDFWPAAIGSQSLCVFQVSTRYWLYYQQLTATKVVGDIFALPVVFVNLFLYHVIINWVGTLFVRAEINRMGNEEVLDNLEEGVVLLADDDQSNMVRFANKAARKFHFKENLSLSKVNSDDQQGPESASEQKSGKQSSL